MTSVDVIYENIHFRHDPKWSVRVRMGHPDQGGLMICVACVIEMMESNNVASVRKSVALSGISGILKSCPGALKELLLQDHRVCLHFTASLLGMLHTVEDPATLEQAIQVLVQLLLELQSEQYVCYILDEIDTQLCDQSSVRGFLPTFTFLGKLVDAVPSLPQSLASSHVPLLERLCSTLLYPDESLKASVFYVWQRVWGAGGAAQSLPSPLRDRVCVLLMQTLSHACSSQLTINCLGFLKQLLKLGEVVSVLMNSPCEQIRSDLDQSLDQDQEAQSSTHLSLERCSLPLILKKLLLCGDETLQVASAQCMAAILVHSPSQYCASFIQADVPEFLFERLNSGSEVLLWSVYSCLLLLTEDPLFFSQCHSVYGIESLVRSLKEALRLTNVEVQRQGLLLLTEILERQPAGVRLFPSAPGFVAVAESVLSGVCSPSLQVATQAAHAATALLRVNHQSSPVQYKQLEKLVEHIIARCTELPLPASSRCRVSLRGDEPSSQASRAGGFLLQALVCFHAACTLVKQCSSEPGLKENVFTAPSKQVQGQDPLESLCLCLLHCCDTVCIPTVTRHCELAPSAQMLQHFFSILSYQFSLLPSLMPLFAAKLASSGFFRLALEHKAVLCAGNRNPALNAACCGFLQRLSVSLLSQPDPAASILPQDCEEIEAVLRSSLPSLCCRVCEWPSLLCESPVPQCDPAGPRATQYCLLTLLHLALQHGDRLLPDSKVFSCVVTLLCSVQEQGDSALPPCVLRSALYLLSVTQDKSPDLDWAPLNCISKALSSSPNFASLYTHHPPLLHFLFRYPELAEHFGPRVLELWLSHRAQATPQSDTNSKKTEGLSEQNQDPDNTALLTLLEKSPTVILNLLGMVCTSEAPLAERAVEVLGSFLQGRRSCKAGMCTLLRPTLLQVLQRLGLESSQGTGAVASLPLVLRLLCLMQTSGSTENEMDGIHFKLLYHVSNLAGKLQASNMECLLPAFSYLYCCLRLSPPHCTDRAVSMLLCNAGLMDQLQATLDLSSSLSPPSALLCCSRLLLSSLVTLQHTHSAQVHRSIRLNLGSTVQALVFGKRKTGSLLLASSLRLLQAVLDVDLESPVLCVSVGPRAGQRPLGDTDSSLHPLGSYGAHCLITALYGLLLQKQELLLSVSVNCLGSLLRFLQRRSPSTAQHVVCQPWSRFLLYSLLNSGESCLLHPATLTLLTLLLRYGSRVVVWEPDLCQVLEAVEKRGLNELGENTTQALRQLLTQLQCSIFHPPPTEESRLRANTLMESLNSLPPTANNDLPTSILRVGEMYLCLSDFTVKTDGHNGSQL
ncbi:meiosis inhibitor protein 1 isoform X2 [Oncorhynchus mykiss]|uniref:meiosis inhibitor protein 1 isoform X2 n=1 Tax=Oncorhynchus mykiss TaxID=8022 RepID=UPI001877CA70|nr:meiosis inhibitor protein 1 isoform X2 [Oncorhynchus mykiss]